MDDKTYRRMFLETPWQMRRRHNGMAAEQTCYRRCAGCEGTGKVLDKFRLPTEAPHPTCRGTGQVTYTRRR